MNIWIKGALLFCAVLVLQTADAQKKNTGKSPAKKEVPAPPKDTAITEDLDIPPPVEELNDMVITPAINFDTSAVPDDAFTRDIRQLLVMTGALDQDVRLAEVVLREELKNAPMEMANEFIKRFITEMKEGQMRTWLTNLYIRSYRNAFTHEDVKAMMGFYNTPAGKSVASKLPVLTQSVQLESRKMGAYMGTRIVNEITKEKNQ